MAICDREAATIQYAFLTSLFSLTGRLAGAAPGAPGPGARAPGR